MELQVDEKVAYVATGNRELDPGRETVVFIHGAGQDHTIWRLLARYFACHDRNVLAVDLPGHGRSAGPALRSVKEMADWIVCLLDAAGVEKAAVVGHSMGSLVALESAARYSERVRAVAMIATCVPLPVAEELLTTSGANDHAALEMLTLWGHSPSAHLGGNAAPGMWMTGGALRLLERMGPGVLHADLVACNDYQVGLQRAEAVSCPVLLVLGNRDATTPPPGAHDLGRVLRDVETVLFEWAGHALLSERPDEVLDALIRIV